MEFLFLAVPLNSSLEKQRDFRGIQEIEGDMRIKKRKEGEI